MDINISRGDTYSLAFEVTLGRTPLNLTGYSCWFTAKTDPALPDTSATLRKGNTGGLTGATIVTSPITGLPSRIQVSLAPTDTSVLPDRVVDLTYDVQVKDGSGNIFTISSGTMRINPDITKST